MDRILEVLGAEQMPWSYKTDCCGGSLMMARTDIVRKLTGDLFAAALDAGAEALVTDCPLCQGNLDMREHEVAQEKGTTYYLPVFYITELIGIAIGATGAETWWKKHLVDPRKLLREKGF
jgi:heterodisulfide reductase subunit B